MVSIDALEKEYPGTEIERKAKAFLKDNLYAKLVSLTHYHDSKYSVIGHGDCWYLHVFLIKF